MNTYMFVYYRYICRYLNQGAIHDRASKTYIVLIHHCGMNFEHVYVVPVSLLHCSRPQDIPINTEQKKKFPFCGICFPFFQSREAPSFVSISPARQLGLCIEAGHLPARLAFVPVLLSRAARSR